MSVFYSFLNTGILNCYQSWCWKVTSRDEVLAAQRQEEVYFPGSELDQPAVESNTCGLYSVKTIQCLHILFIEVYTVKCTFNKDTVRRTFPNRATHVTSIPTKRQHYQDTLCAPCQSLQFSIKPLSQLSIISISFSCFDT